MLGECERIRVNEGNNLLDVQAARAQLGVDRCAVNVYFHPTVLSQLVDDFLSRLCLVVLLRSRNGRMGEGRRVGVTASVRAVCVVGLGEAGHACIRPLRGDFC